MLEVAAEGLMSECILLEVVAEGLMSERVM